MIAPPRIRRRIVPELAAWPEAMHPVLRRIYAARGIAAPGEIEHKLAGLAAPHALAGIERACDLLEQALREDARILIVGDFDADGATGTAVALRGLKMLGARHLDYGVPNRMTHGYGLSPALVEDLLPRRPDIIVTVDNGIVAHAGVAAAKAHGMRVIITDHHLPGASLPLADAIVNPLLSRAVHPHASASAETSSQVSIDAAHAMLDKLAGVGVMFYLLLALRAQLRDKGWFAERAIGDADLSSLLDLVALGTVADLVALDRNNRVLVEAGLKRIRAGRACAGIAALLEAGKRDPARAVASDLGFVVAPRINAAGRLDDIRVGIDCLTCDDPLRARALADTLSAINSERRDLQAGMVEQAEASVYQWISQHGSQTLPIGLVLFEPEWHQGVVGLVASKLKESLHRPVIACALADAQGHELKASGRSVPGFHLRDALAEVDARHPGLLQRYGGHAMAAGMTLPRSALAEFAAAFDAVARAHIEPDQCEAILYTDGELAADEFSLELAEQLRFAGPWGQAFAEPLFDGEFEVLGHRVVGETHLRLSLRHPQAAASLEAIAFNAYTGTPPAARVRVAYALDINEWNGTRKLQLLIRSLQTA